MRLLSLDEVRSLQLALLKEFDKFCKENNLTYYLFAGTLLGAVRHKGFIPWDNDIDLAMPRSDYDRLIVMFSVQGDDVNNQHFGFHCHEIQKEYMWQHGRIYAKGTWMKTANENFKLGLSLDIFPLDNQGSSYKMAMKNLKKIHRCVQLRAMSYDYRYKNGFYAMNGSRREKIRLKLVFNLIGGKKEVYWVEEMMKLAKRYSADKITEYFGCNANDKYIVATPKELYEETVYLEFENGKFPVPIGYDKILRAYYGDYMELPPVEKQNTVNNMKIYMDEAADEKIGDVLF